MRHAVLGRIAAGLAAVSIAIVLAGVAAAQITPGSPTVIAGPQPTATPPDINAETIGGGIGKVTNIKTNTFTVVWSSDVVASGAVIWGQSMPPGTTAVDHRGSGHTGQTHYVDIGGLVPNTLYYFALRTTPVGAAARLDDAGGQYYRVRTATEISGAAPANFMRGIVLRSGGASQAANVVVTARVRDVDNKGFSAQSQIVSTITGADGRFILSLQVRAIALTAWYLFSNEGDAVDLTAEDGGTVSRTSVDTALSFNGGPRSAEVPIMLAAVPTATPVVGTPTVAPSPSEPPSPTRAPVSPTPAPPVATPPLPAVPAAVTRVALPTATSTSVGAVASPKPAAAPLVTATPIPRSPQASPETPVPPVQPQPPLARPTGLSFAPAQVVTGAPAPTTALVPPTISLILTVGAITTIAGVVVALLGLRVRR